jgi:hypothetical protein
MNKVKKFIGILFILSTFCFAEWSGDASQPSSSRQVDGKTFWSITSPEELAWFKAQIEAGNDSINAILENDIIMGKDSASVGSAVWTAIGASDSIVFKGVFDGNHHAIYGLKSEGSVSNHGMFGLFGIVGGQGVIKNLDLKNVDMNSGYSNEVYPCGGGIVAYLLNGTVDSSFVSGRMNAKRTSFAGGLVGQNARGTVSNSTNKVVITHTGEYTGYYVGGIVGKNGGTVSNCINYAAMSGSGVKSIGVIGTIGGIVGYNVGGTVLECVNVGNIHVDMKTEMSTRNAEARVGGIVGFNYQGSVSKCANYGSMKAQASSELSKDYDTGTLIINYPEAGGIVGVSLDGLVENVVNYGTVEATCPNVENNATAGGIVGMLNNSGITNGYSMATVQSNNMAGSLVGMAKDTSSLSGIYAVDGDKMKTVASIDSLATISETKDITKADAGNSSFVDLLNQKDSSDKIWSRCAEKGLPVIASLTQYMCSEDLLSNAVPLDSTGKGTTVLSGVKNTGLHNVQVVGRDLQIMTPDFNAMVSVFDSRGKMLYQSSWGMNRQYRVARAGRYILKIDQDIRVITVK